MAGCESELALRGFSREVKKVLLVQRKTLAYDRGSEIALHEKQAKQLSINIYFVDHYMPWQRGSNENTVMVE